MEKMFYYPLGSVLTLRDGTQKLIIIGRGLNVKDGEETNYYDYGAVPYPLGITEDRIVYFNHSAVDMVLFSGYNDDDNQIMNTIINQYVEEHPELRRKI